MVIHGQIIVGFPNSLLEWRYFTRFVTYHIKSLPYSLDCIHRIIRGKNAREICIGDYEFSSDDPRLKYLIPRTDPRIHFLLCLHNRSSPHIRIVLPHNLNDHLRDAAMDYCANQVIIDSNNRCVVMSMLFDWYEEDFHPPEEESKEGAFLSYIQAWLSDEQKREIAQLVEECPKYEITYEYDWSPNPWS